MDPEREREKEVISFLVSAKLLRLFMLWKERAEEQASERMKLQLAARHHTRRLLQHCLTAWHDHFRTSLRKRVGSQTDRQDHRQTDRVEGRRGNQTMGLSICSRRSRELATFNGRWTVLVTPKEGLWLKRHVSVFVLLSIFETNAVQQPLNLDRQTDR